MADHRSIEIQERSDGKQMSPHMQSFFADVEDIKRGISSVRGSAKRVGQFSQEMLMAVNDEKEQRIAKELAQVINTTQDLIKRVTSKLEGMKRATQELHTENQLKPNEHRIRENLHAALQGKFASAFDSYKNAQQKYSEDLKGKVKRQVQIIRPDANEQFIEDVMQQEGGVQKLYEEAIMKRAAASEVVSTYERTVERYAEARKLEQSVSELAEMFLDFAVLVEDQGGTLDHIEGHVLEALEGVEFGNENLEESIKYQKSARKYQCCVIMTITLIAAVVIVVFVFQ